ncbi:class E sortase [Streptomyces sp. NPDC053560]|uniref:class E sortase n=1 Tax=Streptomyces sp. NPDC053560 TaxID=3365711 RepID=UPI0037CFD3D0
MTALRPEREGTSSYGPYDPYGDPAAFEAAVGQLGDPLTDPLPGQDDGGQGAQPVQNQQAASAYDQAARPYEQPSGFRPAADLQQPSDFPSVAGYQQTADYQQPAAYEPTALFDRIPAHDQPPAPGRAPAYNQPSAYEQGPAHDRASAQAALAAADTVVAPAVPSLPADDETMALRQADPKAVKRPGDAVSRETTPPTTGGRAERRRAAQAAAKRGGRRGRHATPASETPPEPAPTSRVAARQAARARKESVGVVASRITGEAFITLGVLMLLFVAYQLWWTNVLAHNEAGGAANNLQQQWDKDGEDDKRAAGAFSPGEGFAIMYIPKLDVKVPIAEGISKHEVLDRGMVGHYGEGKLKTAMPWDKTGNFAVAGHRNTHGEPFRYINRLVKGDKIVVETRTRFYTYEMASILPQTLPSNVGVIGPVPPGSGFTGPGRYLTLTTCTPEFTSTYRMIVWGKMVEERPRSKGKPDALVS